MLMYLLAVVAIVIRRRNPDLNYQSVASNVFLASILLAQTTNGIVPNICMFGMYEWNVLHATKDR